MLKIRLELTDEVEVLVAEDGEKGCEIAAAKRPDLILMDLEMPVVDGWEATRRLKSKPETRDIPVIGLSGCRRWQPNWWQSALNLGLHRLPHTRLARTPRMANFALWATACGQDMSRG